MPLSSLLLPSENRNGWCVPAAAEENPALAERKLSRKLPPSRSPTVPGRGQCRVKREYRKRDNWSLGVMLRGYCTYPSMFLRRFEKGRWRQYVKQLQGDKITANCIIQSKGKSWLSICLAVADLCLLRKGWKILCGYLKTASTPSQSICTTCLVRLIRFRIEWPVVLLLLQKWNSYQSSGNSTFY